MNKIELLREKNRQMCLAQGLSVRPYGNAWHIQGKGVDFVASELAHIQPSDLRPFYEAQR